MEEPFYDLWKDDEFMEEEGPEEFSGFLTSASIRDMDTTEVVIDFHLLMEKKEAASGMFEE